MMRAKVGLLAVVVTLAGGAMASADDLPSAEAPVADAVKAARPHHVYLIGSLRVTQPWIDVASAADGNASGYLVVENRSGSVDRLTGATIKGASGVAVVAGDAAGLTVPANGRIVLQPGQAHLALRGLHDVAVEGPPLDGTLTFERSGSLHLSFARDRSDAIREDQSAPISEEKPVDLSK